MKQTRPAKCIAFLGTGSDVGKSIVVTAIGRIFKNRGWSVAPYKAQNMSNNSYVTLEGGEMGRAQVVQAEACGIEPHTDMNPVLLKPNTDIGSQVVLQGKAICNALASEFFSDTSKIREPAFESLERLKAKHDLVVIEGAGSCAEVNLRDRDYVNFETAHAADAPVILVADIDRGGVFAQIVGSLAVMPEHDRQRVAGFIINKFRGDASLFDDGIAYLEEQTGLPVLGLIPYYRGIEIDPEDGMPLETVIDPPVRPVPGKINIACLRLPHISNFTDFNPLIRNAAVSFHYLSKPRNLEGYDALMIPGTKNVRFDLQWLKDTGWEESILGFKGHILGVCGGYQMLGKQVHDPLGIEGDPGSSEGFDLLDLETTLEKDKVLSRSQGRFADGTFIDGYEIHMGKTTLGSNANPMVIVSSRNRQAVKDVDGAVSPDGRIAGSYFHGLFDFPEFRNQYLSSLNPGYAAEDAQAATEFKQTQYDLLATHFEQHLDMDRLMRIVGGTGSTPSPRPHRKHPAHFPPTERFNTPTIILVTVCSQNRQPILNNDAMHERLLAAWEKADAWRIGKYVVMPDHIHLFCSPAARDVSLKTWVQYWKSMVSRAELGHGSIADERPGGTGPSTGQGGTCPSISRVFQRDFWDTQLRQSESYSEKWAYVRNNPVRAELVEASEDWPYQGELHSLIWLTS
ncbi:Cobyric acid synthase [Pontiella desulfatans]|uniref:Cobyric acid synthase n=1 Tax=Pontiella desulfatans TaxID=2750659 RepID=A0A6C2U4B5_PONDE|nr:cobyric acid synthase [Pontiella desulfatans]VGO14908.1 Cobyric acid synthase [Pontiella desulfatans]